MPSEPVAIPERHRNCPAHGCSFVAATIARADKAEAALAAARALADELGLALPERLHDLYAAALCVSDLPIHDWAECDHKTRWERDARAALAKWEASK